jgi:hypothetical protein
VQLEHERLAWEAEHKTPSQLPGEFENLVKRLRVAPYLGVSREQGDESRRRALLRRTSFFVIYDILARRRVWIVGIVHSHKATE